MELLIKKCKRQHREPNFIPVIFHNLSGYDSHLFIKRIGKIKDSDIKVIPNIEEKDISFSIHFTIDSFQNKKGKKLK